MLELAGEREPGGFLDQGLEIVIVRPRVGGHGRVEEPTLAYVDTAEKLPVSFQSRMERIVGGAGRKALEPLVQLAGTEHRKDHELIETRPAAGDPDLLTNGRATAVATYCISG